MSAFKLGTENFKKINNIFERLATGQKFPALVTVCMHIGKYLAMEIRGHINLL